MKFLALYLKLLSSIIELVFRLTHKLITVINRKLAEAPIEPPRPVINKAQAPKPQQGALEGIKPNAVTAAYSSGEVMKDPNFRDGIMKHRRATLENPDGKLYRAHPAFIFGDFSHQQKVYQQRREASKPFVLAPLADDRFTPGVPPRPIPEADAALWIAQVGGFIPVAAHPIPTP